MTREELFEDKEWSAAECEEYNTTDLDTAVQIPITKEGFEALVHRAAGVYDLPVDDMSRICIINRLHNSDLGTMFTMQAFADLLLKSCMLQMTYNVMTEIKEKNKAEAAAKAEANKLKLVSNEQTASNTSSPS